MKAGPGMNEMVRDAAAVLVVLLLVLSVRVSRTGEEGREPVPRLGGLQAGPASTWSPVAPAPPPAEVLVGDERCRLPHGTDAAVTTFHAIEKVSEAADRTRLRVRVEREESGAPVLFRVTRGA